MESEPKTTEDNLYPMIQCCFALFLSDLEPKTAIEAISLPPTSVRAKGTGRSVVNEWSYEGSFVHSYCVETVLIPVVEKIMSVRTEIVSFCEKHSVKAGFIATVFARDEDYPVCELGSKTIKMIADLDAAFSIETYNR